MAQSSKVKQICRLLNQHAAALQLYARQWSSSPEDCVQEAFVKLAAQTEMPDKPVAWLYRVVRNGALNWARTESRRSEREKAAAEIKRSQFESEPNKALEQLELAAAIEDLPAADRELIVLRVWSELTWQQIAELTNQSSSSAHRNYVQALSLIHI